MKSRIFLTLIIMFFSVAAYAAAPTMIDTNHLGLTLVGFFGVGLLLAFTPCVLPMIPILSGIIVGQQKINPLRSFQLSSVFVLSMAFTYSLVGVLAGYLGSTIQSTLQSPWVIISFSMVFVIMALSMFGYFDLKLPTALQNYIHKVSNKQKSGSLVGVAIMGILSTLIASPCVTAPLISVLTYIGETGNSLLGGLILFVLALGMGVPLLILGAGQGILLPKTGAWMNKIKPLFGVMMLGLAIWMLSRLLSITVTTTLPTNDLFTRVTTTSALQKKLLVAKTMKKPAMVEFYAAWCSDCKALDRLLFSESKIQESMQKFVAVRADLTETSKETNQLKKNYHVYGTPTIIFYDKNGKEIPQRLNDNITLNSFQEILNKF